MKYLFIIPARGGSKGIPHKNIKNLAGKPLIYYSIDIARNFCCDEDICVTTDDQEIKECVEQYGLHVPFLRPDELATDQSGTYEVILHAISYYESIGKTYDVVVLLQPTSPFRKAEQVKEAITLYSPDADMVVSVKESHAPTVLCNENQEGFLELTFNKNAGRRQDMSRYYEYNGAIYVMNIESLKREPISAFKRKIKYVMDEESSLDIDTPLDWKIAECIMKEHS